ncbi:acyltransferase family protein [Anaerosporobacter sp.]
MEKIHTNKQRIYFFDNLKAILILLVVMGHMIDLGAYKSDLIRFIYFFIYYFHMPLFIFITGYFSKNTIKCREQVFDRFFIPYVILVVLSFLQIRFMLPIEEGIPGFRVLSPPSSLWFILALVVWKYLLHDLVKIRYVLFFSFIGGLLVGFSHEFRSILALGRIGAFTFFLLLGYYAKEEHLERIRKIPKLVTLASTVVIAFVVYYLACIKEIDLENILCSTHYDDNSSMEGFFYRGVYYIIATIMIIVCINLASNKKSILTTVGQRTFTIYYFHMFFIRFIESYGDNITIFKENEWVYFLFVVLSSLLIVCLLSLKCVQTFYDKGVDLVKKIIFRPVK